MYVRANRPKILRGVGTAGQVWIVFQMNETQHFSRGATIGRMAWELRACCAVQYVPAAILLARGATFTDVLTDLTDPIQFLTTRTNAAGFCGASLFVTSLAMGRLVRVGRVRLHPRLAWHASASDVLLAVANLYSAYASSPPAVQGVVRSGLAGLALVGAAWVRLGWRSPQDRPDLVGW